MVNRSRWVTVAVTLILAVGILWGTRLELSDEEITAAIAADATARVNCEGK